MPETPETTRVVATVETPATTPETRRVAVTAETPATKITPVKGGAAVVNGLREGDPRLRSEKIDRRSNGAWDNPATELTPAIRLPNTVPEARSRIRDLGTPIPTSTTGPTPTLALRNTRNPPNEKEVRACQATITRERLQLLPQRSLE